METIEEFKNSFFYGKRKDLLFKFLKNLSPDDAQDFLASVLRDLGGALDTGDIDPLVARVYEAQYRAYQPPPGGDPKWSYETAPFTPLQKPLSECRVALVTSSGHFVEGDDPKPFGIEGLSQDEAENRIADFLKDVPALSEIPVDTPRERLRVRHPGYDVRGALLDPNVTFPLDPMRKLVSDLHDTAYSFVGAASQLRLKKECIPEWVRRFMEAGVEAMVLVPV